MRLSSCLYETLPNIMITSETRKVCFISFIHKDILKFVKSDDTYSSEYLLWYFRNKRAIIVHGTFEKTERMFLLYFVVNSLFILMDNMILFVIN